MTSWLRASAFALWLTALPVPAQSDVATSFAETIPGASDTLHRVGMATVDRHWVPFYAVALYVPRSVHHLDQLRSGLSPCRVSLLWLVPQLSADDVRNYWRQALEMTAGKEDYPRIQRQAERLAQVLGAVQRGQDLVFDYVPDAGMRVLVDDALLIQLAGVEFNRALLGIWFGERASPQVRNALTAGFAPKN